jgi:hypothetical protein
MVIIGTYGDYGEESDKKVEQHSESIESVNFDNIGMATPEEIQGIQTEELKVRRERLEQKLKSIQEDTKKIKAGMIPSPENEIDEEIASLGTISNNDIVLTFKVFERMLQKFRNRGILIGILIGLTVGIGGAWAYIVYG